MGGQSQNLKRIDDLNGYTRRFKKVKQTNGLGIEGSLNGTHFSMKVFFEEKKSFWKQWQYICLIPLLIIRAEINGYQDSTVAVGNRERANSH